MSIQQNCTHQGTECSIIREYELYNWDFTVQNIQVYQCKLTIEDNGASNPVTLDVVGV